MIKIPYKLVNGIMLIPATANDKEGFFAFDTGAMQTAINKAYFHMPVLIMDLMYAENALKKIMPDLKLLGSLGIDVIRNYTVLLDYTVNEIILDPEYAFENQTIIPMSCEKLPVIEVEAANRTCQFVLDTGANTCLLGQSFQDDPQLILVSETQNIVTIPIVHVGENDYKSITATISDISAIQKRVSVDGVIGYQILSPQRSVLDFKNNRIIMEKPITSCL